LVKIEFHVDKAVIAYIMQQKGISDFGISAKKWNRLLRRDPRSEADHFVQKIQKNLNVESSEAEQLKSVIEKKWRQNENDVLLWLRQLTKTDFRTSAVRVCIVPFPAGQVPFRDLALIVVGKIRQGWDYPETIAHELAHILFNQNLKLGDEVEHPYVQLIEEEIAVRLGVRSKYFDYDVPSFAEWVRKAQQREKAWKHYAHHTQEFKNISQFISENEKKIKTASP
jgi:hypothetical protein